MLYKMSFITCFTQVTFSRLSFSCCFGAIGPTLPTGVSLKYLVSINLFTQFITNGQNVVAFFLIIEDYK